MTTIDLDDLPVADGTKTGRPSTVEGGKASHSRRDVIGYTMRGATLVGLMGLSLFRAPRQAGAENPPWNEFTSCGPYDPGDVGQDYPCHDNMCIGTTLELMDNGYCTNDCNHVSAHNWYQWHKNKTYGPYQYRDYPGNICAAGSGAARDAWWWRVGNCGYCAPAIYRCHDGEKRSLPDGEWAFTICEGLARCSGSNYRCP